MRLRWGPPSGGWPSFSKSGKRIKPVTDVVSDPAALNDAATKSLVRDVGGPATDECDEELGF